MEEIHYEWCSVDVAKKYVRLHRIGEGAFGEVRLGKCRQSGQNVALKALQLPANTTCLPKAVFREMESLKQLSCDNIINLLDTYPEGTNLVLVLEYAHADLGSIILHSKEYFDSLFIEQITYMILNGLKHCHGVGILHRDIKPSNVLLTEEGVAKIADFGLARLHDPDDTRSLSHQVSTRWYRAPELLYASRHYGPAVDIWSAGMNICWGETSLDLTYFLGAVIAELIGLCPLFPGSNDIDQMFRVFQVMGTPSPSNWPVCNNAIIAVCRALPGFSMYLGCGRPS